MRNRDEIKGKAKQLKGRTKQAVGDITDNERLRGEGAADEAVGRAREGFGKTKRRVGESLQDLGRRIKRR